LCMVWLLGKNWEAYNGIMVNPIILSLSRR
jgi:hypothetical protein